MAEKLELTGAAFTGRALSFMNLMRDPEFHARFDADPSGTAMREFQLKVPAKAISTSNQMLAALLKNKDFSKWCGEFQARIEKQHPQLAHAATLKEAARHARASTADIQREFADGVITFLPEDIRNRVRTDPKWISKGQIAAEDDIAILLLVFVAIVVVVVAPKERGDFLSRNTVRLLLNQIEVLRQEIGKGG